MLIGAHVGVSGGYPEAIDYSVSVGCEAVQIFAKSPRQWQAPPTSEAVAALFRSSRSSRGIGYVCTHTAYLINLGSDDDAMWERSWRALADELRRAALLGADATVTHVGTNRSGDVDMGADRVARGVAHALEEADVAVMLLLENTAGAGATFGSTSWEIGAVLQRLGGQHRDRVGVCLDTCHAHAAGYDLSAPGAWTALLDEVDMHCGPGAIRLIHANDCAFPPGTHRDRHAWIGDGTIGTEGFRGMFLEPRLAGCPAIIEMPGELPVKDAENVRRLKALREACAERDCGA